MCQTPSNVITCLAGTHQVGTACIPDTCSAVDANNKCVGCVSVIYEVSNGACVKKTCSSGYALNEQTGTCKIVCSSGQQEINGACYNVPANCVSLTSAIQCSGCTDPQKYQLKGGVCSLCTGGTNSNFPCKTCPLNQFVSSSGTCVKKYSYCSSIDLNTGKCISC